MAIGIAPKETIIKASWWMNALFYFSIALLLIIAGSYFALGFFQEKSQKILDELKEETTPESQLSVLRKEIEDNQKRIKDFSDLIGNHKAPVNFFEKMEGLTHPRVWFSSVNLNIKKSEASLTGKAGSFEALGQQILLLKKEDFIENINLSGVSLNEDRGVSFNLNLTLSSFIFSIQ